MYKRLITPSEEEVNNILKEGYSLHSVTSTIVATNSLPFSQHALIYHFIKEVCDGPDISEHIKYLSETINDIKDSYN